MHCPFFKNVFKGQVRQVLSISQVLQSGLQKSIQFVSEVLQVAQTELLHSEQDPLFNHLPS